MKRLTKQFMYGLGHKDCCDACSVCDVAGRCDGLYTRHEVACIIADLFGGTCACDYSGNDEWLPYYCEFNETAKCPNAAPCWEQYLLHKDKREERDD